MKQIPLTRGKIAVVDDADYEALSRYRWACMKTGYAARSVTWENGIQVNRKVYMHREILRPELGVLVDHINGDKLDNRRSNLRLCNTSQNCANAGRKQNNTSGAKGVTWNKRTGKFVAQIKQNRQYKYLGYYDTLDDASSAYQKAAKELFGDFSHA